MGNARLITEPSPVNAVFAAKACQALRCSYELAESPLVDLSVQIFPTWGKPHVTV